MLSFIHRRTSTINWLVGTCGSYRTGHGVVTGIATSARTDLASFNRQFGFTHLFWNLTKTWFSRLRKCLHALTATTIPGIKLLFRLLRIIFKFPFFRLKHGILSPANKILNRTTMATTGFATPGADFSPSLIHRHHTNTWFFMVLRMFTLSAAIFEPLVCRIIGVPIGTLRSGWQWSWPLHFGGIWFNSQIII